MSLVTAGHLSTPETTHADFAAVFAENHAAALRLALLLCGDPERARDIVAECFAKMYPHWQRGRVDDPERYVKRAVVNAVRDGFRRKKVEQRVLVGMQHDTIQITGDAQQHVADREALRIALRCLTAKQRAAIVLRYYEGLSEADTAAVLGVSVGTVKSQVFRGLARLREELDARGGGA